MPESVDALLGRLVAEAAKSELTRRARKVSGLEACADIKALSDERKVEVLHAAVSMLRKLCIGRHWTERRWDQVQALLQLLGVLLRASLALTPQDCERVIERYCEGEWSGWFPLGLFLAQVRKVIQREGLSDGLRVRLEELRVALEKSASHQREYAVVAEIVASGTGASGALVLDNNDPLGKIFHDTLSQQPDPVRAAYASLINQWRKASGSKPSQKFLQATSQLVARIGAEAFASQCARWLRQVHGIEVRTATHTNTFNGQEYSWTASEFLHPASYDALKGMVWSLQPYAPQRPELLAPLSALAERCYQKIPGKGPIAPAVGNAAIYVLGEAGLEGLANLSRLKLRVKQSSTVDLIDKYLTAAADRLGVTRDTIEDMAVPDYGLREGADRIELGEYVAAIEIDGPTKVSVRWHKRSQALKSEPAAVKASHPDQLKALKLRTTQIQKMLPAQRDRLDRALVNERWMAWEAFATHYLRHGLMGWLTRGLIWRFRSAGTVASGFWLAGRLVDHADQSLPEPGAGSEVAMWHPVDVPVAEVLAWRGFLDRHQIRQPIKQAHREVYLLTDAELTTRTYSNRMAAHILKQHQFNSLAKTRGWKYALLGAYDDGRDGEVARMALPGVGLQAEYWINQVVVDDAYNETGIWLYVSTDQVRFTGLPGGATVPLIDVPKRVFSEVMRDVDLFVGVASVGNDPQWQDSGGPAEYRNYWQSYSFGELGELAKSRREALTRLLPLLKIAKVASIQDKFLVVKGSLRTYKIHIGSGNILMEPNDQYLCIVPDRKAPADTDRLFLPFEGDNTLSIVLSKAFLLAEDDKITDPTIARQIG